VPTRSILSQCNALFDVSFRRVLTPNQTWRSRTVLVDVFLWLIILGIFWMTRSPLVPRPLEMLEAFPHLMEKGLIGNLISSLVLNIEALFLTAVIGLTLSYLTVLSWMRLPIAGLTKLRFLGFTGLTFFFTLATSDGHALKLAMLTFGMTVYFVTSMVDVVSAIPRSSFDYARTLRMGEWRVVWEVVIRGTRDQAIDVMRQNAAMGWMMLTMVEALVRSEGGIGTLLLNEDKHFKLSSIFALQLVILAVGLGFDTGLAWCKRILCPYAFLKLERR
jgi:NitT/TauT family transport system permease protein